MIQPARPSTAGSTRTGRTGMSFTRPSSGVAGVPRPATASLLARGKTAGSKTKVCDTFFGILVTVCTVLVGSILSQWQHIRASRILPPRPPPLPVQTMPGAHKPQRPAQPSNDSILRTVAGEEAYESTRRQTRQLHGEIVDDVMMRELHSLSTKKERVCWATSIPPSVASVATHYSNVGMECSPAPLHEQQHATPPTIKRGANYIKGGGGGEFNGDETPQYGSASPRYGVDDGSDYGAGYGADDTTPRYDGNAASPSASSPALSSTGRYSASTAASRTRLIEEAKARQPFTAQSPFQNGASASQFASNESPSALTSSSTRQNVLTPHTRPTGPGLWPDVDQQKAAAAEKRQLYKEQLDMQISAKKSQLRLSPNANKMNSASSSAAPSPAHPARPAQPYSQSEHGGFTSKLGYMDQSDTECVTPVKFVNAERPNLGTGQLARSFAAEGKFAVYENEKAITPLVNIWIQKNFFEVCVYIFLYICWVCMKTK